MAVSDHAEIELVDRLLDAAADVLDSVGFEPLTLQAVADEARVPLSVVEQHFDDRLALARKLADRNLNRYVALVAAVLNGEAPTWRDAVDLAIDSYVSMFEEPGFIHIRLGDVIDDRLLRPDRTNNDVLAASFVEIAARFYGIPATPAVVFGIQVAVELSDSLLPRAFAFDPGGDLRWVEACRQLLKDHLDRVFHQADARVAIDERRATLN